MGSIKALAIAGLLSASAGAARAETVYRNDFSGGGSLGAQTLQGGAATDLNGSPEFPTGPAAYFNGAGVRSLTLGALDLSTGGVIRFDFRLGAYGVGDQDVFEGADGFGEDVSFGYSIDGGETFEELELFGVPAFSGDPGTGTSNKVGWNGYSYTLAAGVAGGSTIFRFLQGENSGVGFDQWAVDNLLVANNAPVAGAIPEPGAWALMIVGFGAAGAGLRRRRRAGERGLAAA